MLLKKGCATLRAIEMKDRDILFHMINEPEIEIMTLGWHQPISLHNQEQWIDAYHNDDKNIRLMIELSNGKTIGMISLTQIDWKNRFGTIGFKTYGPAENRIKGDILDACGAMIDYAFHELGLNRLEAGILEYNFFSQKLAKKLNFIQEGVLRNKYFKKGKYCNEIRMALLRSDYEEDGK